MFRKRDTGDSRQLLEGIDLTTLVHGDKTLMGQFILAKGSVIPLIRIPMNRPEL